MAFRFISLQTSPVAKVENHINWIEKYCKHKVIYTIRSRNSSQYHLKIMISSDHSDCLEGIVKAQSQRTPSQAYTYDG